MFQERRDLAVVSLLAEIGIRRAEPAGRSIDDVDLDVKLVRVLGKGRRLAESLLWSESAFGLVDGYLRVPVRVTPSPRCRTCWLGTAKRLTRRPGGT